MIRLFLPPERLLTRQISITGDQARHLSAVLRVKAGDPVILFDGSGHRYVCRVVRCHKREVIVENVRRETYSAESPVAVTLAQGLPKADKMDFIVQKSTELGVRRIVPLVCERSQVRHTGKVERWRKIALSASQQSGRETIPEVTEPAGFQDFIAESISGPGIILSEEEKEHYLSTVLRRLKGTDAITLLCGPEGGFSKGETGAASQRGYEPASLGPRILRTETAPIAALSIVQFALGDMG